MPVLVTSGVALSQLVKQNQFGYVPELNEKEIATALLHCLQNLQEAKQMGMCARQFVLENYNWDTIATNLIEVYQAILDQKPLPLQKSIH